VVAGLVQGGVFNAIAAIGVFGTIRGARWLVRFGEVRRNNFGEAISVMRIRRSNAIGVRWWCVVNRWSLTVLVSLSVYEVGKGLIF
jgi:hypothetical protein